MKKKQTEKKKLECQGLFQAELKLKYAKTRIN